MSDKKDLEFLETPITEKERDTYCSSHYYNCDICPYGRSDIDEECNYVVNCAAIIKEE